MTLYLGLVLVVLASLLVIGAPVVFAIGAAGFSYFVVTPGMWRQLSVFAHKFFTGMDSFVFLCIPLFVMAGEIMNRSGMLNDLVRFCQVLVGRFRGGMAYVNVLASMLFGGISGSALADVSALGPIEIGAMNEDGYPPAFSAALTATSAIQGPIIPPSIPMVIFASLTNVSVGALFLAGAVPGILVGVGQMTVVALMAKRRSFPRHVVRLDVRVLSEAVKSAVYALMMPVIILGGILGGVFTPTEAAAISVGYSLLVSAVVYRSIDWQDIREILANTARTTASIYLIVAFTSVISWVLAAEKVPLIVGNLVSRYVPSPYILLFLVNLFFLFNGMWISDVTQLVLFAPLFTPILSSMGVNPIHFGAVMVLNVMIGLITPPYGTALYLSSIISGVSLRELVRETIPFTCVSILVLFICTYCPNLVLFLPRLAGLVR